MPGACVQGPRVLSDAVPLLPFCNASSSLMRSMARWDCCSVIFQPACVVFRPPCLAASTPTNCHTDGAASTKTEWWFPFTHPSECCMIFLPGNLGTKAAQLSTRNKPTSRGRACFDVAVEPCRASASAIPSLANRWTPFNLSTATLGRTMHPEKTSKRIRRHAR